MQLKVLESLKNGQLARFWVTFSLKLKYFLLLYPRVPAEREYRGPRSFTVVFFGVNPPPIPLPQPSQHLLPYLYHILLSLYSLPELTEEGGGTK